MQLRRTNRRSAYAEQGATSPPGGNISDHLEFEIEERGKLLKQLERPGHLVAPG